MGDKNFRLSHDVRPERYRFRVAPDLVGARFSASGTIELVVERPARAITLHGVHLDVASARLRAADGERPLSVSADAESQTLRFEAEREVPAGAATLELAWSGAFQQDLRGFYLAGGIGVTQFEAADARRVFPCFDEPTFKAVWELALDVDAGAAAISNSTIAREEPLPDGRRRVHFGPTPKMSSYLVAMILGRLVPSAEVTVRGVPIRTWAAPDKAHLCGFAQECAAAVLPLLEDYFGRPYAFGKLDQIGIPDFEAGAMENAGCITFREIALLIDPDKAPLAMRKRVAEVITHELAHQWFGNLVTMRWWDDLWLNEAFATWMAFKIVDQWRPGWRMWDDFENGKAAALHLDAMESTHPIRGEVRNAEEATEHFDLITYEKGGAMLRMIEGYLGAGAFREGIRRYMKEFGYANTVADDLWSALGRASGQPIEEVANGWIAREGYPLVEVTRQGARVTVAQRRFHADPARFGEAPRADERWLVPLVVRWADEVGQHESRLLLREARGEIALPAKGALRFVCANRGGAGFYRVKYAPEELALLAVHGAELLPVERMNLLADAWALFRAGAGPLASLCDLLAGFARDEDYAVLGEVVARLELLERRYADERDREPLHGLVETLFAPQLQRLGWDPAPDEPDERRLHRAQVVRALALVARAGGVVEEARSRFSRAVDGDRAALDVNLLDVSAIAAARVGDAAWFDRLLERLAADPDPAAKRRYLVSLASFESPPLVARAVDLILHETVPMQDVTVYVGALLAGRATRDAAWAFVRAHWPEVHKKSAAPMLMRRMVECFGELTHRRAEVEAFLDERADSFAAAPQAVRQTRERLRLDDELRQRAGHELHAWLAAHR
jgi:puromycin-sensitive aminopeptidase